MATRKQSNGDNVDGSSSLVNSGMSGKKKNQQKSKIRGCRGENTPTAATEATHNYPVESDDDDEQDLMNAAAAWAAAAVDGESSQQEDNEVVHSKAGGNKRAESAPTKPTRRQQKANKTTQHSDAPERDTAEDSLPVSARPIVYSLHVTQLSYDATDFDVRHHFIKAGCAVTSVRLVYDREMRTKTFRGVAFVDVADAESFEVAVEKLHGSTMLQRKINVRPVKTRQELAAIVKQTTEQVSIQIQKEKAKKKLKDATSSEAVESSATKKRDPKRKGDQRDSDSNRKGTKRTRHNGNDEQPAKLKKRRNDASCSLSSKEKSGGSPAVSSPNRGSIAKKPTSRTVPSGPPNDTSGKAAPAKSSSTSSRPKLTKQQRNRRAAILRSQRR